MFSGNDTGGAPQSPYKQRQMSYQEKEKFDLFNKEIYQMHQKYHSSKGHWEKIRGRFAPGSNLDSFGSGRK